MFFKSTQTAIVLLSLTIIGCDDQSPRQLDQTPYTYKTPDNLSDGITVAPAVEQGITNSHLVELVNAIRQGTIVGVDSILLAMDGELILEEYFAGWQRDDRHDLRSATKSITALLLSIGFEQGILSPQDSVYNHFYPYYGYGANWAPIKENILLQHFMDMSSGLDCDDYNEESPGNESKMARHRDWVRFILDLEVRYKANERFAYCTGGVQVTARMLEDASGSSLRDFAARYLFLPLGIDDYQWSTTGSGRTEASGHIFLRPRDMLKLGLLLDGEGMWHDRRVITSAFVDKLHNPRFNFYGDFWWHQTFTSDEALFPDTHAIFSAGNGGQHIFVFSELHVVLVLTASNYNQASVAYGIIKNYLLPAVYGL